jgi:molecular chaperone GrpE
MPESDERASAARDTGSVEEPSLLEGNLFVPEDDPGLDVLEGLAQEDIQPAPQEPTRPAPCPAPEPAGSAASSSSERSLQNALAEMGEDLVRRIEALRSSFDREIRAESSRERVLDRLHAELQDYKQDLLLKVQRPIFIDLIQLHDDVGKMMVARAGAEPDRNDPAVLRGILESIQTGIEDILYRQGVEPFSLETNEFDPRRQRAISTSATDQPALNKAVAARIRKGFAAGDKLIRPELVSVFLLRQAPPSNEDRPAAG